MQRRVSKTCCGRQLIIITSEKPIRANHVQLFRQAGFNIPDNYVKSGLLQARKDGFTATVTFGICNINVKCNGARCNDVITLFESIVKKIESQP